MRSKGGVLDQFTAEVNRDGKKRVKPASSILKMPRAGARSALRSAAPGVTSTSPAFTGREDDDGEQAL
jgi:hypothetical protein